MPAVWSHDSSRYGPEPTRASGARNLVGSVTPSQTCFGMIGTRPAMVSGNGAKGFSSGKTTAVDDSAVTVMGGICPMTPGKSLPAPVVR